MKAAVLRFPGSNCDQDALFGLKTIGVDAEYVWHGDTELGRVDCVFVPGGFSYGDYLRCGAMAAVSPIMSAVRDFAAKGGPVIGVCNGFQILCESGLLPGALLLNEKQKFLCLDVWLKAENRDSFWTKDCEGLLKIPIAHGEGRFICEDETLKEIEGEGQVAFRYVNEKGEATQEANVNGSMNSIAGVLNRSGNVLGMMPHPERAVNPLLGGNHGKLILEALLKVTF